MRYKYEFLTALPRHIISVTIGHALKSNYVPVQNLQQKHWSRKMINLARPAVLGATWYTPKEIKKVAESPEFSDLLREEINKQLRNTEPITKDFLLRACYLLFDLNKHIKTGALVGSRTKIYELKRFFLWYMYQHGFASIVYELHTQLYRFNVVVCDREFIWHQPAKQMKNYNVVGLPIDTVTTKMADTLLPSNLNHEYCYHHFNQAVLNIICNSL